MVSFLEYLFFIDLNPGRVEHHAHGGSDGLGGEGAGELGPDNSVSSVGSADLAPDYAELGSVLSGLLGLGDVRDLLSEVKVNVLLGVDAADLDEGGVVVLVAEAALVSEVDTLDVQTGGLGGLGLGHFFIE